MDDIYDLLDAERKARIEKMDHPIPHARVVEREVYILTRVVGKVVLDIGATGPMHTAILEVAKKCYGIDIIDKQEDNYTKVDLDRAEALPDFPDLEIVIAGEVIEHLSNAGHFLDLLKKYDCPILLTTPNAFSAIGAHYVKRWIEHVNREHVCYYSFQTLSVLFERHGYQINDWCWYNGKPNIAEGLICLISKKMQ